MKVRDENDQLLDGTLPESPGADVVPMNRQAKSKRRIQTVREVFEKVLADARTPSRRKGLSLGHYKLDWILSGLRPENVTTLGARTSFGKTSKALHIANLALEAGKNVVYITNEDNEMLTGRRLMAARARINAVRLRAGECTPIELRNMERAVEAAEDRAFFLNGIGVPIEDILDDLRNYSSERQLDLVIYDYLQKGITKKRSQDRRNEVTHICNTMSDGIKQLGAAGLLLSQCKRPGDSGKQRPPSMDDLKESGDIENGSEHVLIGWAEEHEEHGEVKRRRKIRVEKNKDGPLFDEWIDLSFDEVTASFRTTEGEMGAPPHPSDEYMDGFEDGSR